MKFYYGKGSHGKICITFRALEFGFNVHLLPRRDKWKDRWGFNESWYDGPLYSFGLGPVIYVCWSYII